jgi:SAM-dependent methyltransferase
MRRVLERIRRLTVPSSVIDKLAELEARIGAADAAYRELSGRHQTLAQEHEALNARNAALGQSHEALNARHEALNARHEALQSNYQKLERAYQDLAARHQADMAQAQSSLKDWSERSHLAHRAQTAKIVRNILSHRSGPHRKKKPAAEHHYEPHYKTIQEQREALRIAFPHLFPIWDELFENARHEYEGHPEASLSVPGNQASAAFGNFLSLYAHGSVLDVGCGIQESPIYLDGLVIDRLAGVDPLASQVKRKFEFVQGLAEFLPWENDEFDLVVAATSLDHVVSLDMALSEIKRVLRPGGYFVTWVGFVAGAKRYDPTLPDISPIDRFHIFHFDRGWFVELMARYFRLEEEFALDFQSHFFAFSKA